MTYQPFRSSLHIIPNSGQELISFQIFALSKLCKYFKFWQDRKISGSVHHIFNRQENKASNKIAFNRISPILQTTFPRLHLCILYYYKYSVINYHLLSIAFLRIVFIAIITAAYELLNFWYFNLRDYGWKTISSNMSTTFTQAKKYTVINYKLHL